MRLQELNAALEGVESEAHATWIRQQIERTSKEAKMLFADIGAFEATVD